MELQPPNSFFTVLACAIISLGMQQKGKVFTLAARKLPSCKELLRHSETPVMS